jgi:aryl-phospho-beta-D-glucosidase BglC (GH1 family)
MNIRKPFNLKLAAFQKHIIAAGLLLAILNAAAQTTVVNRNGRLKLAGRQLTNEKGYPIQLRGMSSHGLQWFGNCMTANSIAALVKDWGCDIIRAAMYVNENGYLSNKSGFRTKVDFIVDEAAKNGVYCMIDWHMLTPGDPMANINDAKEFFDIMAKKHAGKKHVLYEICNEPNGVDWSVIKGYAEQIIPIIRKYDPEAIIIVGTPSWSGKPGLAAENPITGDLAYNLMYTFHFYAGSHTNFDHVDQALTKIPLFVTEWGVSSASGNTGNDYVNAQKWLDLFAGGNSSKIKVSWMNWSYADKNETSASLKSGSCNAGSWNNTTEAGTWVKARILSPADDFGTDSSVVPVTPQQPYTSQPFNIPGTIEAEDFDQGGQNIAYMDTDSINRGGEYRTDGPDIEKTSSGAYMIAYTEPGEWLEYSVKVPVSGTYTLQALVASGESGGSFHLETDGNNTTGKLTVSGTGGWDKFTSVSQNLTLTQGNHILKFYCETAGFNLDKLIFSNFTPPAGETGTGLSASYFNGKDFETPVVNRIDPVINFNWETEEPAPGLTPDAFSARWTGFIVPRFTEEYTFYISSNDGVRLWVNNQLLVNDWTGHALKTFTGKINLLKGQKHDIKIEYFEDENNAEIKLEWESASQTRQVVPAIQLYPSYIAAIADGIAELWDYCSFDNKGNSVSLKEGSYSASSLASAGIRNDYISAVRIQTGYEVVLFDGENFTGDSVILKNNTECLESEKFDNKTSSAKIRKSIVTGLSGEINFDVQLYPVPSDEYLKTEHAAGNTDYLILTPEGIEIMKGKFENNEINISGLNPGLYLIKLNSGEKIKYGRFIRE